MALSLERPEASVACLEIQAAGVDPIAARLRAERMLGTVELRPRSLGRRAVLCVRELRDPLPGTFPIDGWQARVAPAWEQALERQLDRLARGAAWPARGAVPPSAEAVAFADEAELLACLGSDLVADGLAARWWWPLLVQGMTEPARAVGLAFARAAEHVPAALQLLSERRHAEALVQTLAPEDRARITAAVRERFALPVARPPRADDRIAPAQPPLSPWRRWVDEAEQPQLPFDARLLLGIALSLARAPVLARALAFSEELAVWRAAQIDTREPRAPPVFVEQQTDPGVVSTPPERAPATGEAALAGRLQGEPEAALGMPVPAVTVRETARVSESESQRTNVLAERGDVEAPAVKGVTDPLLQATAFSDEPESAPVVSVALERAVVPAGDPSAPGGESLPSLELPARWQAPSTRARRPLSWRPRTRAFGPATDTTLGGLFYLINAALHARVYGGDDEPVLALWDFLTLVGRRWLGTNTGGDPVWALLAALAGRAEDEPPGASFAPPRAWKDARTENEAAAEHQAPPLERWMTDVASDLEQLLGGALDVTGKALATTLLVHRARVHVTDTHLDVVLSLDELPVMIRLAGLDRDPGWVAAAGRFVAFHFE